MIPGLSISYNFQVVGLLGSVEFSQECCADSRCPRTNPGMQLSHRQACKSSLQWIANARTVLDYHADL